MPHYGHTENDNKLRYIAKNYKKNGVRTVNIIANSLYYSENYDPISYKNMLNQFDIKLTVEEKLKLKYDLRHTLEDQKRIVGILVGNKFTNSIYKKEPILNFRCTNFHKYQDRLNIDLILEDKYDCINL